MTQPTVVFIIGPTASGKTDLAVELAARMPMDIVSVDSAMIYRDMNIGTAKPDAELLARAPHRLIDIIDPAEVYSAARFRADALREIDAIHTAGRTALLVGGTMLYFKALEHGLSPLPPADAEVRRQLLREAEASGWPALHQELSRVDPQSAARIHPNDPQRIQRALEVYRITGRTRSEMWREAGEAPPFRILPLMLAPAERSVLHERIARRFDLMLQRGFVDEVAALRGRGDLTLDSPSMRAVGYRQVWEYLSGVHDQAQMRYRGIVATRQLAKRQLTWMRGRDADAWLDSSEPGLLQRAIERLNRGWDG